MADEELTLLERRTIEARIVGPLINAFIAEIGPERALGVVREVITHLARSAGSELAGRLGETSLQAFAGCLDTWKAGGALELDVLEDTATRLSFNVTRCRFAEMYRALGLGELGGVLSCQRDYSLASGFNPSIVLERSQTIMEGAPHCDFRFKLSEPAEESR